MGKRKPGKKQGKAARCQRDGPASESLKEQLEQKTPKEGEEGVKRAETVGKVVQGKRRLEKRDGHGVGVVRGGSRVRLNGRIWAMLAEVR